MSANIIDKSDICFKIACFNKRSEDSFRMTPDFKQVIDILSMKVVMLFGEYSNPVGFNIDVRCDTAWKFL